MCSIRPAGGAGVIVLSRGCPSEARRTLMAMLVEDTAAFIEQLEVREAHRRAKRRTRRLTRARLDVMRGEVEARIAGDALWRLASQLALVRELGDAKGERALIRDIEMVRGRLRVAREKLQECRVRLERAERDARLDDGEVRKARMFRLHSARHHLECSERRFARLASSQVERPVLVASREGRRWWWYRDRFWWDDEGLSATEVATLVLRTDLQRQQQADDLARVRASVLGHEPPPLREAEEVSPIVRFAVWCRDRGRCVDCRATEDLEYQQIVPFSKGGLRWIANVELRCAVCRDRRMLNTIRTEVSRARIESTAFVR